MSLGYDSDEGYGIDAPIIRFTDAEREEIDKARDELHIVTLKALKAHGIDSRNIDIDISEAAESISLEGFIYLPGV